MQIKHTQAQAPVPHQKQNRKAKGKPKVQNVPGKALRKSKTDYGESEKQASSQYPQSSDSELNSELQKAEPDLKTNPNVKASTLEEGKIQTKNLSEKMDESKKQKLPEDKPPTEQAPAVIPNVAKPKPPDSFNQEQEVRETDKDDSGSDGGYTTPKKRKAKYNVTRPDDNLNIMRFKLNPPAYRVPILKQGFENLKLHSSHQMGIKVESPGSVWKSERWVVGASRGRSGPRYTQKKAFDRSPGPNNQKVDPWPITVPAAPVVPAAPAVPAAPVIPEEEAWSLFKQPSVFSMASSNVPKPTYASKVKQNLHKFQSHSITIRSCPQSELSPESSATLYSSSIMTGTPILMPSHRLSQVPMSSLELDDSLDSVTGPGESIDPDSSQVLPLEARLIRRPSSSKSVTHKLNPSCPSLFPCPSHMPAESMGLMPNVTRSQTEIQMLKEIFQNEWGLSFISDVSMDPEFTEEIAPDPKVIQPPQPHKYLSLLALEDTSKSLCVPQCVVLPKIYNMSKWLNPQGFDDIIKSPAPEEERETLILDTSLTDEPLEQAAPKSHEAFIPLPSNYKMENPEPLPISLFPDSTLKDSEQKNDWEPFNFRAAVEYHMAEMQSVLDIQKEDPQRVIIYDESMDS